MEVVAKLNGINMSPRKMRYWTRLVNGLDANYALGVINCIPQKGGIYLKKLLLSAISNWHIKYGDSVGDNVGGNLFISSVVVNSANTLKRIKPAPQGRAHRIRKRYNNVVLVLSSR